ncbi:MAG: hypothetical protein NZM94_04180 [Roseiflexus sp.]|nr:hypothetical protein [Roseiflexus sp.]
MWWDAHTDSGWVTIIRNTALILGIALGQSIVQALKARVTYPRTGYVRYRTPTRREIARRLVVALGIGGVLVLAVVAGLIWGGDAAGQTVAAFLTTLLLAAVLGAIAYHQASRRYGIYAALALIGGMLVNLATLQIASAAARNALLKGAGVLIIVGAAMLAGGAWTLNRHLHAHPLIEEQSA